MATSAEIKIFLNGEEIALDRRCSVKELLSARGLDGSPCAVEVNGRLVPKRDHETHTVQGGDSIEIVTLVGGG